MSSTKQYWLMKAEPDSRLEKGVDVAFGVDKFQDVGTTQWDGVRSHEAKKIMKEKMRLDDGALFYHSNCKLPGVAALAKIAREGYPDHTAWDEKHPYYDAKSKQDAPTWFMVDVAFVSRLSHFVSLKLLQHLASLDDVPDQLDYLTSEHLEAIKGMALLNRGRLSVQPVSAKAYEAIELLGEKGGFDDLVIAKSKSAKKPKARAKEEEDEDEPQKPAKKQKRGKKAKGEDA